ncbi:peptidase C14, caspase catalytic subunit p20 [Burkholderia aenigmatica]|uniref:Peptidase C14, caspase catalytic subunit p20 n=1 Tax=Burkholderia aenigmatica TaxID=2015348 RepID=A0A6J5ISK8_9BURK|nr:caspase family protein [Burkholderia aenigmatica]CAB3961699.1 peptidase C14, caspase catalytic subunit p20 [Burkholderia aenigmatica]
MLSAAVARFVQDAARCVAVALALVVLTGIAPAHAADAPRVALVIGNATYRGTDRLEAPTGDAELVARALRGIGFQVTLEQNRSRTQLLADLDAFGQRAAGASIALVYYAGHGFEAGGENYLIPVDLPVGVGQVSQGDLQRYAVPLRYIQSSVSRGDPRALLILLDACRSSATRGATGASMTAVRAPHGTLVAFATQPGGVALDSFALGSVRHNHSPFAYYLSQELASAGDITTILRNTQVAVAVATEDAQRPWYNSGLIGTLRLSDTAAPAAQASVRQRAPLTQPGRGAPAGDAPLAGNAAGAGDAPLDAPLLDNDPMAVDERALARKWRAETLRLQALVIQMAVNPTVVAQVRRDARNGDLFAMTALAMALVAVPNGTPPQEAQIRVGEGMMYMNAAADRNYPMAEAMRAGVRMLTVASPADSAAVIREFRAAVDHGFAESLPRLLQLLALTGDGNLGMYLAKYRRIYGRDYDFSTTPASASR